MTRTLNTYLGFCMAMLSIALFLGMLGSFAGLYPEIFNNYLPFYQLRPMHVSGALFWLIGGAACGILWYKKEVFGVPSKSPIPDRVFMITWMVTVVVIFCFYAFKKFGGREYWEFPPFLCLPILISWLFLMYGYFPAWRKRQKNPPLYVWMWTTGIVFFLITFLEQNLYQVAWFRQSFLRELTIQWKSNGAMVGAWNQMIYGTSLFIMVKLTNDEQLARGKKAFFFYFLGLTNLMFNWGHHIYNLPTSSWIRHVSYGISMTEWIILVSIIQSFRKKVREQGKSSSIFSYRLLIAAEYWVLANLVLALGMSIPAINRFTHGTHITVAHAMGATIGINTMILLASFGYMLKVDLLAESNKKQLNTGFIITQVSLALFWLALITAGIVKAYQETVRDIANYRELMLPVNKVLHVFAIAGIGLFTGINIIIYHYNIALRGTKNGKPEAESALTGANLQYIRRTTDRKRAASVQE
jgi:nitric oxide reductase subunit B